MKFIVIKSNLKNGLSVVERASVENLNLPILKNVLIETSDGKIKLTTTNLEIAINYFVAGKVIEPGKTTAPINTLVDIINNIQSDRLNLESKKNNLEIKTDNYEANIQGLPSEDFPITPKIKNTLEFIDIKTDILSDSLIKVLVAGEFSDLRPELNSILLDFSLDTIKLVATDSFRLAEKTLSTELFESNYKNKFKLLIPLKTAVELVKILKNEGSIRIYKDENQILFQSPNFSVLSRLAEGNFPEYQGIVPRKFKSEITFERQEFVNALKLASIFGYKNNEVKIKVHEGKKTIEVFSADQVVGENKYLLPAKINGKTESMVFNWRYLADVLRVLKSDEIFFGINDENEPALLQPVGDNSYFYMLKPIVSV